MSVLSDGAIREYLRRGVLVIEPFTEGSIQPASVDLTLGEGFLVRKETGLRVTDPARGVRPEMREPEYSREHGPYNPQVFVLSPLRFVLGTTRERVELPAHLTGRLEGKSSLARLGLIIHATGGNIDPGFAGQITLEMFNASDIPIVLRSGMQIAHISFLELDRPAERPYGHQDLHSHYQDQVGVTASRYGAEAGHAPVESGTAILSVTLLEAMVLFGLSKTQAAARDRLAVEWSLFRISYQHPDAVDPQSILGGPNMKIPLTPGQAVSIYFRWPKRDCVRFDYEALRLKIAEARG